MPEHPNLSSQKVGACCFFFAVTMILSLIATSHPSRGKWYAILASVQRNQRCSRRLQRRQAGRQEGRQEGGICCGLPYNATIAFARQSWRPVIFFSTLCLCAWRLEQRRMCDVAVTCGSHHMLKNEAAAVSAIFVLSSRRNLFAFCSVDNAWCVFIVKLIKGPPLK